MNRRLPVLFLLLVVASLLFTSCAPSPVPTVQPTAPTAAPSAAPAAAEAQSESKVAIVLPGSINDNGFNANAYKGLQEIGKQGFKTAFTESVPIPDMEAALRAYAEQGYNLVIGHGFQFGDPVLKVAPSFPNVNFFVSNTPPPDVTIPKNVSFVNSQEFQAAYLSGMVAGLMTKSNKVGYVGGMSIPSQLADLAAFTKGVESVNPDAKVLGVMTETFSDPAKGQEVANAQIANGADVIMQTADSTGMGAMQAAIEKNVYLIGYGGDQRDVAPKLMLTSLVVDVPKQIAMQADRIKKGTFGGDVWVAGIKEGTIDVAPFNEIVPKDVQDKVMAVRQDIIDGKFKVPEIYERLAQ
jgi:basic membrane protein A and related proteins